MKNYLDRAGLAVAEPLVRFLEDRVLPDSGLDPRGFWDGFAEVFLRFAPENGTLLQTRDHLQAQIDAWHRGRDGKPMDNRAYQDFLHRIGYLVDDPAPFHIAVDNVDDELARMAGPQLVVPILNARFLLNAANARWGSLYDALYGTDVIPGQAPGKGYDQARGAQVIAWTKDFLDRTIPLASGRHVDVEAYAIRDGNLFPALSNPALLVGYQGEAQAPTVLLFRHHGLHLELRIDRDHPVGRTDRAGVADVILEAAITTIADLEDSVSAVDVDDKVAAYANWLELVQGSLESRFLKGGETVIRRLADDRIYRTPAGDTLTLPGRSVMLIRNVGLLLSTSAVRSQDAQDVPEGILDAIVTSLIAMRDIKGQGRWKNSRAGSIYIVKPKLHGPAEAAFTNRLFDAVEDLLKLKRHTIKIGVMDEERRTSANLAATIGAVRNRIVFINTGFLDRTGDEIHTSMMAGAMVRKGEMKNSVWLKAYEERNVAVGLACGFSGKAQIGKGMWAMPDRMSDMLQQKIAHPQAGANTAWVPSPTAATLHAMHYHQVDVPARQHELSARPVPGLDMLLRLPLSGDHNWSEEEIREELDNNAQSILGYVARWIQQGVGCSKVPDIHDVSLMEDRATLRISSQLMANWLHHGVCTAQEVDAALVRMAAKVDAQNAHDPSYRAMTGDKDGPAFQAARALIFQGADQPNGYTEPLLHRYRRQAKAEAEAEGGAQPGIPAAARQDY